MCAEKEQSQFWHESMFLSINPLNNYKWLHKQSYGCPISKWEKVLSHQDRACRILHAYRLVTVGMLEIPVRFSIRSRKCQCHLHNTCFKYFWRKDLDYPQQIGTRVKLSPTDREAKIIIHVPVAAFVLATMVSCDQIAREEKGSTQEGKKGLRQSQWHFLLGTVDPGLPNCYRYEKPSKILVGQGEICWKWLPACR